MATAPNNAEELADEYFLNRKPLPYRTLSLWQPWASLIYDLRKKVETRHWYMSHRGPLAIHAAMRVEKEACEDFGYDWATIPRGAVLCIVNVKGCVRFPHPSAPPDEYGDFYEGRYGILMEMLERFAEPIPAKGHQGIWNWERPQPAIAEERSQTPKS